MFLFNKVLAVSFLARVSARSALVVDLGYESYQGYNNPTLGLNIYQGIRYAAAPIGNLRWQKPQPPVMNRSQVLLAMQFPPRCPQGTSAPIPPGYNFTASGVGTEDCLFLSVFAPENAVRLPVMVFIHGGGYVGGQGNYDYSEMMTANGNGFVYVGIQYRLGAFGFLSSAEIASQGVPNAGLYDLHFALQWVHGQISKFGGDPSRVTISGESAGGGGVMHMAMAYGGTDGSKYFQNAIVASPYLPRQWDYNDPVPTQSYNQLAQAVGCSSQPNVFACLQKVDSFALQNASAYISGMGPYGQYTFAPVTDGNFVQQRPAVQLLRGNINGLRMLSGNNADEAPDFVPRFIDTEDDFNTYINGLFPLMDRHALSMLERSYAIPATASGRMYATTGNSGPTALNQSSFGTGQQQRAINLYAETTFVCPSYWLASAFPTSWKYQYSPPPAEHAADMDAYLDPNFRAPGIGALSDGFRAAMQQIWGNFIINNDPTLSAKAIKGIVTFPNGTTTGDDIEAARTGVWPTWKGISSHGTRPYQMLNLNMTGGTPTDILWSNPDNRFYVTQYVGPGLEAKFEVVDAWSWEGGRGKRCDLWARLGHLVPE